MTNDPATTAESTATDGDATDWDASTSTTTTTTSVDTTTTTTTVTTDDPSADASSTGTPIDVPGGVFLWTGAGGGGPGTDLYVESVAAILEDADVDVLVGVDLPADFVGRFGTLVYMNPRESFPESIDAAATALVEAGGRLVLVMEHCKNGCWGNADGHNALLAALGAGMRVAGDGGADLSVTALDITLAPPLTDGVSTLVVYYSGHVEPGDGTIAVGTIPDGDVVVAMEEIGAGEVVAITDSSILGYVLDEGDNTRLVENFARH